MKTWTLVLPLEPKVAAAGLNEFECDVLRLINRSLTESRPQIQEDGLLLLLGPTLMATFQSSLPRLIKSGFMEEVVPDPDKIVEISKRTFRIKRKNTVIETFEVTAFNEEEACDLVEQGEVEPENSVDYFESEPEVYEEEE